MLGDHISNRRIKDCQLAYTARIQSALGVSDKRPHWAPPFCVTWHEAGQSFSWGINWSVFARCAFGKTKFETRDLEMGKTEGVFDCDAICNLPSNPFSRSSNGHHRCPSRIQRLGSLISSNKHSGENHVWANQEIRNSTLLAIEESGLCPRLNKKGGHIRQKKWRVGFKASTSVFYSETNPPRTVKLPPSIT